MTTLPSPSWMVQVFYAGVCGNAFGGAAKTAAECDAVPGCLYTAPGKTHKWPLFWANFKKLIEILSKTAERQPCKIWANRVHCSLHPSGLRRGPGGRTDESLSGGARLNCRSVLLLIHCHVHSNLDGLTYEAQFAEMMCLGDGSGPAQPEAWNRSA